MPKKLPPIGKEVSHEEAFALMVIAKLDSIDERLKQLERIGGLVEEAIKAVALESKNKADIAVLDHRVAIIEARFPGAFVPPVVG